MKIVDITCQVCAASYQVAEAATVKGSPGQALCTVCGNNLATWDDGKLRAFRMVSAPQHKYARVPVPPSPDY